MRKVKFFLPAHWGLPQGGVGGEFCGHLFSGTDASEARRRVHFPRYFGSGCLQRAVPIRMDWQESTGNKQVQGKILS